MKTPRYAIGDSLITPGNILVKITDIIDYEYVVAYNTPESIYSSETIVSCRYFDAAEDVIMDYTDKVNKSIQEVLDEE